MFTVDTVLDSLKKFDIDEKTLQEWEKELGLEIPVDEYGRRQYSPHHINLFKNIKKHLALGRTMDEIKKIISLPPVSESRPKAITRLQSPGVSKPYASVPRRPLAAVSPERSAQVLQVIEKLVGEKDNLHRKLIETEKLNSHLYNANNMFHRKVKELSGVVTSLKDQINENRNFKLLDEKSRLHAQLIESEKNLSLKQKEVESVQKELDQLREQYRELELVLQSRITDLEGQLDRATRNFDPDRFRGDWEEQADLLEIEYDNFGINIETARSRVFRISEVPERTFGNTAVITTQYEYENNKLWKRMETLIATHVADNRLEGELLVEYVIDGVPVAKGAYRVTCKRIH